MDALLAMREVFEVALQAPAWMWIVTALLYPVYQILGTVKHELGHVFGAWLDGRGVTKIVVWPQRDLGWFTWGYVRFGYDPEPLPRQVHLMPYIFDLIWFLAGWAIVWLVPDWTSVGPFWSMTAVVLVVLLPITDFLYNLWNWLVNKRGDLQQAFGQKQEPMIVTRAPKENP